MLNLLRRMVEKGTSIRDGEWGSRSWGLGSFGCLGSLNVKRWIMIGTHRLSERAEEGDGDYHDDDNLCLGP